MQLQDLQRALDDSCAEAAHAKSQLDIESLVSSIASGFIHLGLDEIDTAITDALRRTGEFAGVDRMFIVRFSEDGTSMEYTSEWCAAGIPSVMARFRGTPVTAYPWWMQTLKQAGIVHVPRVNQLPAAARAEKDLLQALGIRSHVIAPLVSNGTLIGCVGASSLHEEQAWQESQLTLLRKVAVVFTKLLLRKRAQQRLATHSSVANILAECRPFREAFTNLLQAICQGAAAELGEFWRVDTAANLLRWVGAWHAPSLDAAEFEAISQDTHFTPGRGLLGWVWAHGKPEWMGNIRNNNRFLRAAAAEKPALQEAFAFPIRNGGQVIGVMAFYSRRPLAQDDDSLHLLDALGSQIGDFIERQHAEDEVRRLNVELERRVNERTAELAAANRELEAFNYSVSHDLRAPLRSIEGFSQALGDEYADRLDEQGRDYLQRVRAAGQRMGQLIEDLLHLSHVTRGEMRREPVDLSLLAAQIAAELQKAQPQRRVAFVIADGLLAYADPRLLRVALENLLGNAWKYTSGHTQARIEFGAIERGGSQVYFVRDDGAGFDVAYAHRLFVPFQRLHSPTEFAGTGIGLATVQRIIHRHGGRIWADAVVESGATFYFTIDSRTPHPTALPLVSPDTPACGSRPPAQARRGSYGSNGIPDSLRGTSVDSSSPRR
jgi:signal transduction histidine kinase